MRKLRKNYNRINTKYDKRKVNCKEYLKEKVILVRYTKSEKSIKMQTW